MKFLPKNTMKLLNKWGFKPKVPQRRFINTASKEEKEVKKRLRKRKSLIYLKTSRLQ